MPDRDPSGHDHERKEQRAGRLRNLRERNDALPVEPIGHDTAGKHQNDSRGRSSEADKPQEKWRVGQTIHEPSLRDSLHPRPDVRDELRDPEAAVIRFAESLEHGFRSVSIWSAAAMPPLWFSVSEERRAAARPPHSRLLSAEEDRIARGVVDDGAVREQAAIACARMQREAA